MATVWINGIPHRVADGTRLSDVLTKAPHPCGGIGVCGKCRVRAVGALSPLSAAEERHLTAFEIADGLRLSCCVRVEGDCRVTVDDAAIPSVVTEGAASVPIAVPTFAAYGVAMDIGTTTLAARLYDAAGTLLAQEGCANPQVTYGADVLSRMQAAGEGADLAAPLREGVNHLLRRLAQTAGVDPTAIDGVVITGNTAMLCLLTATDTTSMLTAPFALPRSFGEWVTASAIGLTALAPNRGVYLPPCSSAFVGADALCAALACGMGADNRTMLLMDMGTNGEILLSHHGELYACSTAAGPAFEGVGISMGMPAMPGAIDAVSLVNGVLTAHVIGSGKAVGVCGSGLVDAASCLLGLEMMDTTGGIDTAAVALTNNVALTQEDIRALQQAKGAVSAALDTLLYRTHLTAERIDVLQVAGGFGSHLNGRNAAAIGLIPRALASRIHAVGNAALDGAATLLLNHTARDVIAAMAKRITTILLATDPYFADRFIKNMSF